MRASITQPLVRGFGWLRAILSSAWAKFVTNKRTTIWVFAGVGVLALVAVGFALFNAAPLSVRVAAVERDVPVRVFGLGTVEARVVSKISFEVSAALVELNADHGDKVKKGDVLARLHATEQVAKVMKAKADHSSAEVAATKTEANLAKARAVLAQRQAANRRKRELAAKGFVSQQGAEEAQRDEDVATAEASVAARDVDVARTQVETARAQLAYEETILDHHTLYAPFDGVVVERLKEVGSVVRAGDAIFTLTDPESVWALAYVDEARAGRIAVGQPAEVRLRSRPETAYHGRVVRVGIESDRVNEERRVYVKCDHCPPTLQLGEQAELLVTVAVLPSALLVPEAAVEDYDGVSGTLWTIEEGRLRRRPARFRHKTEDARLEIVAGLPNGASVAVEPASSFREGRAAYAATPAPP
ncbi:MAG: efflux RND transporter periplasmic adaptor subunit [Alphaproteobacteria bacterium]|nr:efflux RND transporter periplasmic adaptor subunit [Alphaproteobacteria bacterium]